MKKPIVSAHMITEACNGICLECYEIIEGGIEPDAREYECENCGKPRVYGLSEALVMDVIEVSADDEE